MGGNVSFEWGVYELGNLDPRGGDCPIIVSGDPDTFWDEVMMDVCRWIVTKVMMEDEHTPLSDRRMRYVIEFTMKIDVSKWSDQKVRKFSGLFLYLGDNFNTFTRAHLQEVLKQRTEYQKYLVS